MNDLLSNRSQTLALCGWDGCGSTASNAVILGTRRYIMVPAGIGLQAPAPLERRNVCNQHLDEIGRKYVEVHDHQTNSAEVYV